MQKPHCFKLFEMCRNTLPSISKVLCLYVHINRISSLCGRLYNLLIRWKLKIVEPPSPSLFLSSPASSHLFPHHLMCESHSPHTLKCEVCNTTV